MFCVIPTQYLECLNMEATQAHHRWGEYDMQGGALTFPYYKTYKLHYGLELFHN